MKIAFTFIVLLISISVFAASNLKFNFENEEISHVLKIYAEASGQHFIIDSNVQGKITILNSNEISIETAYAQLSDALAVNGFLLLKQADGIAVKLVQGFHRVNFSVS